MSTAQQTTQDSRDFVKAAQNEALSQALADAGFGIQLIDVYKRQVLLRPSGPVYYWLFYFSGTFVPISEDDFGS